MKNSTGKLISRLIASIPGATFFGRNQSQKNHPTQRKSLFHLGQEENLNRIFLVRYKIQHL